MQKVGCFLCMARQYFLCVKISLGSKRLDTPVLYKREPVLKFLNPNTGCNSETQAKTFFIFFRDPNNTKKLTIRQ